VEIQQEQVMAIPSWAIVTGFSVLILAVAWVLVLVQDAGAVGRAQGYRNQYQRLISELEKLVQRANAVYPKSEKIKDTALLDHYQSVLRMIESLMEAVKKMSPLGEDADLLLAPKFLVKDIQLKLAKVEGAMERGLRGKPHAFMKTAPVMANQAIGCHFCSRPFDVQLFSKVRVKIDGKGSEVAACVYCRDKLLGTRKAKVLFFNEDGIQVHWSKAKAWTPSPEYWNINRDDIKDGKSSHLELVYSSVNRIDTKSDTRDKK
jgi:hypothetical protein